MYFFDPRFHAYILYSIYLDQFCASIILQLYFTDYIQTEYGGLTLLWGIRKNNKMICIVEPQIFAISSF